MRKSALAMVLAFILLLGTVVPLMDGAAGAAPPLPSQLPSAPRNLAASPGNGKAVLTWTAPLYYNGSAITEYWVHRSTVQGNETLWTTLGNVTTFTDIGLTNGQTYYYEVSAKNVYGEGPRSAEATVIPRTTPTAPLDVIGIPGNLFINLTWSAPAFDGGAPIQGYKVYRGTTSGGETLLADAGNSTFFICSRLQIGRTYYFKVSAYNTVGEGLKSNEVASAPDVVPGAPTSLVAKEDVRQVTLTWTAPEANGGSPILGYRVVRGLSSGNETLLVNLSVVYSYLDSGLGNNQSYYYKVLAVNAVGDGAESNEIFATTWDTPKPTMLSTLEGNRQLTLYWNTFDDGGTPVIRYWVYRGTAPGHEKLVITLDNVLSYTDTNLVNGQTYYYRISAENAVGTGMSVEVSGTPHTVPNAPLSLTCSSGERYVQLNWSRPSSDGGATVLGYKVYRGTMPGAETYLADAGNATSFISGGLTNGRTYYYKVLAYNSAGDGPLSNEASALSGLAPSAPRDLHARSGDMYVYLSWSIPTVSGTGSISSYRVYRGTSPNGEAAVAVSEVAGTTYNDTGLTDGQKYYYKVTAVNSIGESANSTEVSATPMPPGDVPSEPRNLVAAAGFRYIKLTWTAPVSNGNNTIIGYKIYRSLFSGSDVFLTQVTGTSYNNTGLENDTTYYYRVAAVNALGTGPKSDEVSATTLHEAPASVSSGGGGGFNILGFFSDTVVLIVLVLIAAGVIFWFMREKRKARGKAKKDAERLKKSAKAAGLKKGPGIK